MKPPTGPKKQTQTNPILSAVEWPNFTYPQRHALSYAEGSTKKSDAGSQRSDICLLPWSLPPVQSSLFLCRGFSIPGHRTFSNFS